MSYNPSASNSGAYASNVYVPGQQQQAAGQTTGGVYVPGGSNPTAPAPAYNPLMAQFQKAQQEQKEQFRQSHVQASTNPTAEAKPVVNQTVASSVTSSATESTRAEPAAAAPAPSAAPVEEPTPTPAAAPAPAKPAKAPAPAPKPFDEPTNANASPPKPSKPTASASSAGGHYGGNNEASFKKEFDKIDKDNNGYISEQELGKLFFNKIPPNLLKQAIGFIDKNKDGKISFDEYKAIRSQLGEIKIPGFLGGGKK